MKAAIKSGSIQESRVTEAVGRILYEMDQFGLLSGNSNTRSRQENTAADEQTVLQTAQRRGDAAEERRQRAAAGPATTLSSLAVIGPGAGQAIATNSGGEAAGGLLEPAASAAEPRCKAARRRGAHITYAVADDLTGVPGARVGAVATSGQPGLLRTVRTARPTQVDPQLNFTAARTATRSRPGSTVHVDRDADRSRPQARTG